jgi:zinc/manganese transport system permease protein
MTEMFAQAFMRNAFLGGTFIALAAGLVGYFLVLRNQVFVGDALSHVAFTGALAALAFGLDLRLGLFATTILIAMGMARIGKNGQADDVVIGMVFAWILGLGVFFLSLFVTHRSTSDGAAAVRVLFGSIFGLDMSAAQLAAIVGAFIALAMLVLARPLLFATLDPETALAQGLPVKALGIVFLALAGACAAEAAQAVGALLLLGLIAAPAGTAQRLTTRPFVALALSAAIAVGSMWLGLFLAYVIPRMPPSFSVLAVASGVYVLAGTWTAVRRERPLVRAFPMP